MNIGASTSTSNNSTIFLHNFNYSSCALDNKFLLLITLTEEERTEFHAQNLFQRTKLYHKYTVYIHVLGHWSPRNTTRLF